MLGKIFHWKSVKTLRQAGQGKEVESSSLASLSQCLNTLPVKNFLSHLGTWLSGEHGAAGEMVGL